MIPIFQNRKIEAKKETLIANHKEHVMEIFKTLEYRPRKDDCIITGEELVEEINDLIAPYSIEGLAGTEFESLEGITSDRSFTEANKRIEKMKRYKITETKNGKKKYSPKKENLFINAYYNFRNRYGKSFVEELDLSVCPYCNRNYINSGRDRTMAQLDHWYNKEQYPLLALTFYNLVPSCPTCNHTKGKKMLSFSPYEKKPTDELIEFSYDRLQYDHYELKVTALDERMSDNIDTLQLFDQYKSHEDIIREIHYKVQFQHEFYIEEIEKMLEAQGLKRTYSAEELYFGTPLKQEKYYLRSLAKFERDIIKCAKDDWEKTRKKELEKQKNMEILPL